MKTNTLTSSQIETPLGPMLAIADERVVYLLEFLDCRGLVWEVEQLERNKNAKILPGTNGLIRSIETELDQYFSGKLISFKTLFEYHGTPFQKSVWEALQKIPHGETRSYADVAVNIGKPTAFRAVANANARNQLAIVIPCHRVINSNGELGGYGGKVERKQWLLDHENKGAHSRVKRANPPSQASIACP